MCANAGQGRYHLHLDLAGRAPLSLSYLRSRWQPQTTDCRSSRVQSSAPHAFPRQQILRSREVRSCLFWVRCLLSRERVVQWEPLS